MPNTNNYLQNNRPLALISVTNKQNLAQLARQLVESGYELLSTGGTASYLREQGLAVLDVAQYIKFPEIMNGRVKTLHPWIHAGILHDRDDSAHVKQLNDNNIRPIDVVVTNLYAFDDEAVSKKLPVDAAIEHIDIGGPTMLRAAAKNHKHCLVVIDPSDYDLVIDTLKTGKIPSSIRQKLAAKVFAEISKYDSMIAKFLTDTANLAPKQLPATLPLELSIVNTLRYGENPHQNAAVYSSSAEHDGFAKIEILGGKELSYNNYLDLNAACGLATELLHQTAIVIIKHTNPCGTAVTQPGQSLAETAKLAIQCDPQSAFGGIIAANAQIDANTALALSSIFIECLAAPDFTADALEVLRKKTNLRIIKAPFIKHKPKIHLNLRSIRGAILAQSSDVITFERSSCRVVSKTEPTPSEWQNLEFAWKVAKHVKSNAIVLANHLRTLGVGAGQMSRIDSLRCAIEKANQFGHAIGGSVLASDAFFPFADTVLQAAEANVRCIIQPGGSKKDQDSIDAANEKGISMVFTGVRHFNH